MTNTSAYGDGLPAWTVHSTRTVYDGAPSVGVDLADVTAPNGERFDHHIVRLPGSRSPWSSTRTRAPR